MGLTAAIALAAGAAGGVAADTAIPRDKAAIEAIVRDYILNNPEIIPQAMERLQGREVARAIAANRAAIETPYAGAWEGAANGDVVLVEFFDYACGYCRQSVPDVERLLREDPRLKVVYRDFPVLGDASDHAAQVAILAAKAGRYPAFHRQLFASGRPDRATVDRIARGLGLDPAQAATPAVKAEVERNLAMQRFLNLTGTPSWIVGDRVLSGHVGYAALKAAIAEARSAK